MEQSKIRAILSDDPWAGSVVVLDEVDSTNNLAKTLASQGAPSGTVLIADRQSAGRGRMGRVFLSPGGKGIYLSVLLRPQCPPQALMHLTCAAAEAVTDAVEAACGFRPGIKWTNDLVAGNRKLGGILTELQVNPETKLVDHVIVGVGLNCGQTEADFDPSIRSMACSVRMISGTAPDRNLLAAQMIRALHRMAQELLTRKEAMLEQYRRDCITIGQEISVVRGLRIRHGTALAVDDAGALVVRYAEGDTEAVSSGEVSIRGLYGYL